MGLTVASRTDVGRRRRTNEDYLAIDEDLGVFVVADGVGGHAAGKIASETGTSAFLRSLCLKPGEPPLEALRRAFLAAHTRVLERGQSDPALEGMGSTLAALWLRSGRAVIGHMGDSRVYLVRDNAIHLLTMDHSLVGDLVFHGQLDEVQVRDHPRRHVITRALGMSQPPEPATAELRTQGSDVFMLCTDGITMAIDDLEILSVVSSAAGDLPAAAERLVDTANERGGGDNSTVVLVASD